jgi:2-oxoglutarate ferredoxin oxidoreductase subunit alpha
MWGTHGDKLIPVFYPGNVQEIMEETIRAFNWAERLRTPVVLLIDEVLGHMRETVDMEQFTKDRIEVWKRKQPDVPPEEYLPYKPGEDDVPAIADYGTPGYRGHATGLHHDYTGFPTTNPEMCQELIERLIRKVQRCQLEMEKNEEYMLDDAEIAIVAFGTTARAARTAVQLAREKGIKAGLLRPITIWPSPEETLNKLAKHVKAILVPELNMGQYVLEVERCAKGACDIYRFNRANGKVIYPHEILEKVEEIAK